MKAEISLEEALIMCQRRGWRGFEARYVENGAIKNEHKGKLPVKPEQFESIDYGTRRKI